MHLQTVFETARVENEKTTPGVFREMLTALQHDQPFDVQRLYDLPYKDFDTALNALREWRSQRYAWQAEHPEG